MAHGEVAADSAAAAAYTPAACARPAAFYKAVELTSCVELFRLFPAPPRCLSPALCLLLCVCLTRLLVIVCENKLLLYDLNTRKPYEVSRAVLDGKAPNCVAFLFRGGRFSPGGQPDPGNLMTSPVLAVGCADGVVRLLHLATLRVRDDDRGGSRERGRMCMVGVCTRCVAACVWRATWWCLRFHSCCELGMQHGACVVLLLYRSLGGWLATTRQASRRC